MTDHQTAVQNNGWILRGGTVIDRSGERAADVAISPQGEVVAVAKKIAADSLDFAVEELDAKGCIVAPGLVDIHTHLREPGREEAETVETGSRAAALGGYTAVVAMPNTEPTIDSVAIVQQVVEAGRNAGLCDVRSSAAITIDRKGEALSPMAE
ncbi:MAG: hypothetical protein RLZZ31_1986, partial [Actinomycetota bacterium]